MKYNVLADTGLIVSELCFGAMTFGGIGRWKPIGEQGLEEALELITTCLDSGINFIDTANAYSEGRSEEILGEVLKRKHVPRSEVVIATKVRARMGPGANEVGLSRAHILDSVDKSLRRLQLDYVDLLYIHGVDPVTGIEETMRGLEDVVRAGRVRYLGVSNHPAWMVMKANGIAEKRGWTRFSAMQYLYALAARDVEHELIPFARSENIGFLPWSPLAGGFLSGKFDRDTPRAGSSRRDDFDFPPINKEQAYNIIDEMKKMATAHGVSVAQIALRWVMDQPGVTSTIIGARTNDQLVDNIAACSLVLSGDEINILDEVSKTPKPYPAWMVEFQTRGRFPE